MESLTLHQTLSSSIDSDCQAAVGGQQQEGSKRTAEEMSAFISLHHQAAGCRLHLRKLMA